MVRQIQYTAEQAKFLSDKVHKLSERTATNRYYNRREEAPDVAQEVLVKILSKGDFDPHMGEGQMHNWLAQKVAWAWADHVRGVQEDPVGPDSYLLDGVDSSDPSGTIQAEYSANVAHAVLDVCDERFVGYAAAWMHGSTQYGLAAEYGVPDGSMKSIFRRGYAEARELLAEHDISARDVLPEHL